MAKDTVRVTYVVDIACISPEDPLKVRDSFEMFLKGISSYNDREVSLSYEVDGKIIPIPLHDPE